MAPEQGRGESGAAQPYADQYSAGVVLYELLTGRTPFSGPPAVVIMSVIQIEPDSPRKHCTSVPRDLETICLKAMAKQPENRYDNCQALADDLRRWMEGEPIKARRMGVLERAVRWLLKRPAPRTDHPRRESPRHELDRAHSSESPQNGGGEAVFRRADRILTAGVRPEDLLAPPPQVRAFLDAEVARVRAECGFEMAPDMRRKLVADLILQHYHAGQVVACLRTDSGVVVLAAGDSDVAILLRRLAPEHQRQVVIEYP
jgi:hypothetical protein